MKVLACIQQTAASPPTCVCRPNAIDFQMTCDRVRGYLSLVEQIDFLPGVPVDHVLARLAASDGNEVGSGKLASPESSAALAVNCFGWFIPRPERLPALPGLDDAGPAEVVDVEFCARFPWPGGRHPWLDAVVQTASARIGVESKRFEPFRNRKTVNLSDAYDRDVWGPDMKRFELMRDRLRSGEETFEFLDAAQLVKHAFGLVTTARRCQLSLALFYIFAEPASRNGKPTDASEIARHRTEIDRFGRSVAGDEVAFAAVSYRDWMAQWDGADAKLVAHREAVLERFSP